MGTILLYTLIDFIVLILIILSDRIGDYKKITMNFKGCELSVKISTLLFVIAGGLLVSFSAVRDGVGADYDVYKDAYLRVVTGNLSLVDEVWLGKGFIIICQAIGVIAPYSHRLMFGVISAITIAGFFYVIYKSFNRCRSYSVFLFLVFGLYYQTFNQIRQMLAISICIVAYYFLIKKRVGWFVVIVIIASLIHTSALIVFVILFTYKSTITWKKCLVYVMMAICGLYAFDVIIEMLQGTTYGDIYIGSDVYDIQLKQSVVLNTFVRIVMMLFCFAFYRETIQRKPCVKVLFNMIILCTLFQVLTLQSYLFGRITTYFFIAYILLLPEIFKTVNDKFVYRDRILIKTFYIVGLLIYHYVYYASVSITAGYNEYQTWLF